RGYEPSVHRRSGAGNPRSPPGADQGVSGGRYGSPARKSEPDSASATRHLEEPMAASINSSPIPRERNLRGQTVVVIGGSSGIGLETARLARANGADMI